MAGTCPTFYLVPATRELAAAVARGEYPACETLVSMCAWDAGTGARASAGMGMSDTEYRRVALGRLLAFRMLATGC
jgi:hypothetical protein